MAKQREMPGGLDIFKTLQVTNEGAVQKVEKTKSAESGTESIAPNIGWLFYRDYYVTSRGNSVFSEIRDKDARDVHFGEKNNRITGAKWSGYKSLVSKPQADEIVLTVNYPGFIAGTGNTHETGSIGEFKIGMTFDHTTGLPYLPGSSVKGVLRSVFPGRLEKMAKEAKDPVLKRKFETLKTRRIAYIRDRLGKIVPELSDIDPAALEEEIFEGKSAGGTLKMPLHDVFFDAWPVAAAGDKLLDEDSITPHVDQKTRMPAPLKDPTPILFLKVSPGVQFGFRFRLHDGLITAAQKRDLFKLILKDLGAGAMTRKGYGNFTEKTSK